MLIKMKDDEEAEDPGPMPQLEDMNPYLSGLRAQLEAADKEEAQLRAVRRQKDDALQAQKIYQARLAEEAHKARDKELAASVAKSALLAEIEVCESVETSSSVEAMEIEAMETPPRAATPEHSLPVTFCLSDAEAEFQFDAPSPDNAKILSLLKEKQEMEIAASQRGL